MKPGAEMRAGAKNTLGDLGNTYCRNKTKCSKKHLVFKKTVGAAFAP